MTDVCLSFEVHQPLRLNKEFKKRKAKNADPEELFGIYFDNDWNREILDRVSEKCYLPANGIIRDNIDRLSGYGLDFKVSYSISGALALQCEKWRPDVIDSFKKLADRDNVEFLNQTYYHSLASIYSSEKEEFEDQVEEHRKLMDDLFDREPKVFENTEFIYNNSIAKKVEEMGYKGIFTESAERILGWRSPNYVYRPEGSENIKTLVRHYQLSDDMAFRFSNRDWSGWPLTADKYANWLSSLEGQCVNIFIDYETFGEHQWHETGILEFLKWLPGEILNKENLRFATPSELVEKDAIGEFDVHDFDTISWADQARSLQAWIGNSMQKECFQKIKELESAVKETGNEDLLEIWRLLQISDHLYYMYVSPGASKEVHDYFSQQSPKEAYELLKNILSDFEEKVNKLL